MEKKMTCKYNLSTAKGINMPKRACNEMCGNCRYMSQTDSNDYGEYWCGFYRKYYEAGGSACGHFYER